MEGTEELLIDQASAAAKPADADLADWAADERAFVSSVITDYGDYRDAAVEAIRSFGAEPVYFENFGGRDADPEQAYLDELRSCSIYVGLLGARYGKPLPSRYSATHAEYREAEQRSLRISMWEEREVDREGPEQSFVDEVRVFRTTGSYQTPDELADKLAQRLREIAAQELSPWIKLGPFVFRARELEDRGNEVTIRATVRDDRVGAGLLDLQDQFARRELPLAWPGRAANARIEEVTAVTRAARARDFSITVRADRAPSPTAFGMNGMSWDELTELAVRVSLFGEDNPLGLMASQAEIPNPFETLARAGASDEALRPIARLLLEETLIRDRGASRITRFALGPRVGDARKLLVEWALPRPYANASVPRPRRVEGVVKPA
jgi:hypothetical protein